METPFGRPGYYFPTSVYQDTLPPLDEGAIVGITVVTTAVLLVALEILGTRKAVPLLRKLDKAGLGRRVRNLIRSISLIAWLATVSGMPIAVGVFVVICLAHLSAAVIQRKIDLMYQSRPAQPVANLKIKKRFDKVWPQLPQIKRRRSQVLYGYDVWLTLGVLAVLLINRVPAVASQALSSSMLVFGFLGSVGALTALGVARTIRRQQNYAKAGVADKVEAKLVAELKKHKPEVLLYFTGARADRYQLEQWLKPVDKLKLKTMVVVREPGNGKGFPACKWPVVVARTVAQLERVTDLASLKLVIYASNAAKNMHMLRNGALQHVYLNHGDSDKKSSANPYSRVYDTLLVAGPAGKKRYLDIGFDGLKPAIVEVGRPQLDDLAALSSKSANKTKPPTILYAPTWEGVANSANYTSLPSLGTDLAKAAASAKTHKLVIKLHPNSGRYDHAMRAATEEISAIAAGSEWVELVEKSKDLFKLFAAADVLISDVSAVVSDFLATQKPLVMTLPTDMTQKSYLEKFPVGNAASLVAADDGSSAFNVAAQVITHDPQLEARLAMQAEVHGSHPSGSQHAFNAVLKRIASGKPAIPSPEHDRNPGDDAGKGPAKVLISLNGLQAGGAERDCLELSSALSDAGYDVTVFAQHGDLRKELDKRVSYLERPADRRRAAAILRDNVHRFDVINTHDLRSLAILAKVASRPPILAIVHNISARRYDHAARWLLRHVPDEVVFVSASERKRVFRRRKPVGTVIRPSIAYANKFVKKLSKVKPDADTILFCGRLSRERGPDLAVKVLPKLPGKTLMFVGDGPMKDKIAKLAADLGVLSRVKFIGAVSDPYPHIAAAGCVLVPSRRDALPRIVRETAALGRPIVAANNAGVREAAGDYQHIRYCDPSNVDEFATCIADSLSAGSQQRVSKYGTSSWQPILAKFDELQARSQEESRSKDDKIAEQVVGALSNGLHQSSQQKEQRNFDRVNQVVRDQTHQPQYATAEVGGRQHQSDHANQRQTERPEQSVVNIEEREAPPETRPDDSWFDQQVGSKVQPTAELASLISPASEFPVGTVGQQIGLSGDHSPKGDQKIERANHGSRRQTSDEHQTSHHMLVDAGTSDSPSDKARDAAGIQPSGPVLSTTTGGQSPTTVLGEANRVVDVVSLHDANPSLDDSFDAAMPNSQEQFGISTIERRSDRQTDFRNDTDHAECIRKSKDGLFATFVAAPAAEYLVRTLLEPRGVSANQVTIASTCCGVLGARLLAAGSLRTKCVGAGTLALGFVLDCADGQLARLTKTESTSGVVLDELTDRASELFLLQQLSRASKSAFLGDAASTLLLARHSLSRLPETKIEPLDAITGQQQEVEDPLRPNGNLALPLGELAMTASHLTIGERLAITTATSLVSARLGVSTHLGLGLLGLGRDLAARQIRSTKRPGASEIVAAATVAGGVFLSQRSPGKLPMIAFGPYALLALSRVRQERAELEKNRNSSWSRTIASKTLNKNRASK